jgi:hypothetical protein
MRAEVSALGLGGPTQADKTADRRFFFVRAVRPMGAPA